MYVDPSDPKRNFGQERSCQGRHWLIDVTGFASSIICAAQIFAATIPSGSLFASIRVGASVLHVYLANEKILEDTAMRKNKTLTPIASRTKKPSSP